VKRIFFLVATTALIVVNAAVASAAPDPDFHIYLLFGQSNMAGGCKIGVNETDCDTSSVNAQRVKVLAWGDCNTMSTACTSIKIVRTYDKWYTAFPPYHNCSEGIGPADYFGKTLMDSIRGDIKIGFIPCALSGQAIAVFEKGSTAAISDYTQPVNGSKKITSDGYGWMVRRCKVAQETGVIKGILFHQGESNSGEGDAWVTKVVNIIKNLKTDLNLSDSTPFIAGELRYDGCCAGLNTYVNKFPSRITNCKVASASGLQKRETAGDNYHFSTPSMREFGVRYAKAFLSVASPAYVPRKGTVAVRRRSSGGEKAITLTSLRCCSDEKRIYTINGKLIASGRLSGSSVRLNAGNVYLVSASGSSNVRMLAVPSGK
jgi:hypothetical protein